MDTWEWRGARLFPLRARTGSCQRSFSDTGGTDCSPRRATCCNGPLGQGCVCVCVVSVARRLGLSPVGQSYFDLPAPGLVPPCLATITTLPPFLPLRLFKDAIFSFCHRGRSGHRRHLHVCRGFVVVRCPRAWQGQLYRKCIQRGKYPSRLYGDAMIVALVKDDLLMELISFRCLNIAAHQSL